MAKRYLPWEEILLWSLLGGVMVFGLSWLGLTVYRWVWNEQALSELTGRQWNLYSLGAIGIGGLLTAIVLSVGSLRRPPTFERKDLDKKRRR